MRLLIDHRTRYRFSEPQARLVQLLRMTPADHNHQTTVAWRIELGCDARLRHGRDGFGNAIAMLYAEGPIDALEITATGEVLTTDANGVLSGTNEPLPPALFLRQTPLTAPDEALVAFAADTMRSGEPLDRMHRLTAALHQRFALEHGRPEPGRTAAEAFAEASVTSRDLTHMLLAAARLGGTPARFVSGYRLASRDRDEQPTPHAWVEACCGDLGWVGFDAAAGACPDDCYVRIAGALDASGAAPVAGIRQGQGEEELAAEVTVERLTGTED